MAKRRMVKYMLKRSQEFVISGYTAGNPFDELIVGCYDGRDLKYVGTRAAYAALFARVAETHDGEMSVC